MTDLNKPKRGETRDRILDLADTAVLEKSFSNTSLEEIIAAAGISRNGFFYHFRSKDELAMALIKRQLERNMGLLDALFAQAEGLHDDPLEVYLAVTELFLPMLESAPKAHGGILVSTYTFQDQHHNKAVRELAQRSVSDRRDMILDRLRIVAKKYKPRPGLELIDLANLAMTIVEGGIIMTDMLDERSIMPKQLRMYREFVRYAFMPPDADPAPDDTGSGFMPPDQEKTEASDRTGQ